MGVEVGWASKSSFGEMNCMYTRTVILRNLYVTPSAHVKGIKCSIRTKT